MFCALRGSVQLRGCFYLLGERGDLSYRLSEMQQEIHEFLVFQSVKVSSTRSIGSPYYQPPFFLF